MTPEMKELASKLEDTTQSLYDLALVIYNLEDTTPPDTIPENISTLINHLRSLPKISKKVNEPISQDVLEYVEQGRNPDVYARQFSELVQKDNQYVHGKFLAMENFQQTLAEEIISAYPHLKNDVDDILAQGSK
ncbi:mediator complex subunit Med10 [Schizosaccharomyces cryophilus OY26]|uniref:Mediator of RNA polymerase II transcription subunit 10 n=1 Tax=Schizosaccharomyces cryophilus (strain OY26 / ATCC MYA-4695 / CBS 11777 / NBRC 106824 / NRRL Y48691) TaxID=653667 RepID=S9W154_SCHCR|nr:mediator complex subunit Med10 [Schizosaccharomyces cryophilus OY26]EPY53668.1 mediator complex subunit Med10 [Schizosaccharomyces cryophilus OY26]